MQQRVSSLVVVWVPICCLLPAVLGHGSPACEWQLAVVEPNSLELPTRLIKKSHPLIDITDIIYDSDVNFHSLQIQQDGFYSYSHLLKVILACRGLEGNSSEAARSYLLTGGQPVVTLGYEDIASPETNRGHRYRTFDGMVLDSEHLIGSCDWDLCEPVWFVPLPLDGSTAVLEVTVDSRGLSVISPGMASYFLTMTGYLDGSGQYGEVLGSLGSSPPLAPHSIRPILYIPHFSPEMTLPLHTAGEALSYLISNDNFVTYTDLQGPSVDSSGGLACGCTLGSDEQFSVVSLPDRLLFVTKFGITEVKGNFSQADDAADQVLFPRAVYTQCIRRVAVSRQSTAHDHWTLLALGGCDNEGNIFSADLHLVNGSGVTLTPVVDSEGRGLCEAAGLSLPHCRIITGAVSATPAPTLLFLLLDTSSDSGTYSLWKYQGIRSVMNTTGEWSRVTPLPLEVPTVTPTDPYPLTDDESDLTGVDTSRLMLSCLTVTQHISNHLFIAGNRLLTSPDNGKNTYIVPGFDGNSNIVLLVPSKGSFYTFLTSTQQLWAGVIGSLKVILVYPSAAWDIVHRDNPHDTDTFTIISMFFNCHDQLQLLAVNKNDTLVRIPVQLEKVLQHIMAMDRWTSITNMTSWNDTEWGEVIEPRNRCPFVEILFELPILDWYTKEEHITFEPPLTNLASGLHSSLSLNVYQALVHSTQVTRKLHENRQYISPYPNHLDMWRDHISENEVFHKYLFDNNHTNSHLLISGSDQRKEVYDDGVMKTDLPDFIYLKHRGSFTFSVHIILSEHHLQGEVSKERGLASERSVQLGIIISDTHLLSVSTYRTYFALNNTVVYKVVLVELGNLGQIEPPGDALKDVSVHLRVHNAPLQCFRQEGSATYQQGVHQMTVMLGCVPNEKVYFDHFRAKNNILENGDQTFDCLYSDPELPCFYFYNGFYPVFQVRDLATGEQNIWRGNYTLKVIGGGKGGINNIRRFTDEEIIKYNNLNTPAASLIVGPMEDDTPTKDGWVVYNYEENGMRQATGDSWFCQPFSPCALIRPQMPNNSEYFFLMEFSNRDVELDSNCLYTMEFVTHVHGLSINVMSFSVFLVMMAIGIICLWFAVFYAFSRNDGALWDTIYEYCRRPKVEPEDDLMSMKEISPEQLEELASKDWRAALELRLAGIRPDSNVSLASQSEFEYISAVTGTDGMPKQTGTIPPKSRRSRQMQRRTSMGMGSTFDGHHTMMSAVTEQELNLLRKANKNSPNDTSRRLNVNM